MKIKDNFILRKVADSYVVVPVGKLTLDFNGIINLNETGAFLFGLLQKGAERDELVEKMLAEYDVERERAEKDIDKLMSLNKEVALDEVMEIMREKLESGGTVTFTPNGISMEPMLRDGKDVVVLKKPGGRLKLFDVPLYRRDNGHYVLHRVIDFGKDGNYIMCGDNQFAKEKGIRDVMCGDNQFAKEKGIRDDQIIAVMTSFVRKGKPYKINSLRYRTYVNFWYYTRIFRRVYSGGKRRVFKLFGITPKPKSERKKKKDEYY